jgi:hypothetical protein
MGYGLGRAFGLRLLRRYRRHVGLNTRRLAYGKALSRRHGETVVIVSRFVVVLRTLAGANHMRRDPFMMANLAGSMRGQQFLAPSPTIWSTRRSSWPAPPQSVSDRDRSVLLGTWVVVQRRETSYRTANFYPGDLRNNVP